MYRDSLKCRTIMKENSQVNELLRTLSDYAMRDPLKDHPKSLSE